MNLRISVLFAFVSATVAFNTIPRYLHKPQGNGQLWAVLVAGSSGWENYRHQADVCHSYQILRNHGIPEERIIVMMADDIAHNSQNPTPGIIINHPNGNDVYKGVPQDYTGSDVTPENFMAVLRGDKEALNGKGSGKILGSGQNDHVFVYFADHGAPGLIAFPESELSAKDLKKTINYMHTNNKYGKMVIYIEACESGSMFQNLLPDNINVYATTAANAEESSYACYFDEKRETYLGDSYSVHWLEDSDKEVLSKETLEQQFKIVKNETVDSHVQEFGDLSIAKMPVGEFQGRKDTEPIVLPKVPLNSVKSRNVPIEIMKWKYGISNSEDEQVDMLKKLSKMYRNRMFLEAKVTELVNEAVKDEAIRSDFQDKHYELKDFECYEEVRKHFNQECFVLSKNPYALKFLYVLVNFCEQKLTPKHIKMAMERACLHPPTYGIV